MMRKCNIENLFLYKLFQLQVLLSSLRHHPPFSCVLLKIWDSEGFIALSTRGFVYMFLINSDISFLIYVTPFLFSLFSSISDF